MIVFRYQTKSDEILHPALYTKGKNVWGADTIDGKRTKHVCTGNGLECIPLDEYRRKKKERKDKNRRLNMPKPPSQSRRGEVLNELAGLHAIFDT